MPNKITPQMIEKYKEVEQELEEFYRQRNDEIIAAYKSGSWTFVELAKKYNISRQRVYKIIKEGK
jgi:Mor family transcriptional regulator